jgi:signal transduction histidine kinase
MSKNKEQSLNIISQKFANMEQTKLFKELSIALEESIKEISGAEYGLIGMVDKRGKQIKLLNRDISFEIMKGADSILQTALSSQKPLFENYTVSHKKYNPKIDNPLKIEIKSMLIMPILNREKTDILGFIQAVNSLNNPIKFGRYDLRILSLLETYARETFECDNHHKVETKQKSPTPPLKIVRRKTKNELETEVKCYEEEINALKIELNSKKILTSELKESLFLTTEELKKNKQQISKYELLLEESFFKKEEIKRENEIKIILNFLTNEVTYFLKEKDKIYLFLEIIKNSIHNPKQLSFINNELENSSILNNLSQTLYTVEKLPLIENSFNIFQAVAEVANLYSHEFSNRNITFNIFINPQLPNWIIGDEEKIKSLMIHLLNNLYGLVDNGGAIELLVSLLTPTKSLTIEIKGLLPNKLKEIKRLFQNKKISHELTTSSSGLGLTICSNLITILEAKLKLTTIGGDEHSFRIDIPIKIDEKSIRKVLPYKNDKNDKKVGILMNESNLYAYLNVERYLLSLGIKKENILLFKNHKKINSTTFFHLFCFENMLSKQFDMSRFNSIAILKYSSEISNYNYGKGIEVHEMYINNYYGLTLQKILFPNVHIEDITQKTLLVKDSFFNRVVNKFR